MASAIIAGVYGSITSGLQNSYEAARAAEVGSIQIPDSPQDVEVFASISGRESQFRISRTFAKFDFEGYSGITDLSIRFQSGGGDRELAETQYICVASTAFQILGSLQPVDYSSFTTTALGNITPWREGGDEVVFIGNETAIFAANNGQLTLCLMNYANDYLPSEPRPGREDFWKYATLNEKSLSPVNVLITYNAGWTGGSDVNGIPNTSIGEINGVTKANIALLNDI